MSNCIKIYLSGPMTGYTKEQYQKHFKEGEAKVKKYFKELEYDKILIINPTEKPYNVVDGWEYEDVLKIDFTCIDICDAICLLPNWTASKGAQRELKYAESKDKKVYYFDQS